jgi:tetratricopeptide (TPR) repeat protein
MTQERDAAAAIAIYRDLLGIAEENFGPDNTQTAFINVTLARALSELGDVVEAETRARAAATVMSQRLGPRNTRTLGAKMILARVLVERGALEEARALALEATTHLKAAEGGGRENGLDASLALALVEIAEGRLREAAAELDHALALEVAETSARRFEALLLRSRVRLGLGQRRAALADAEKALAVAEASNPPGARPIEEARRAVDKLRGPAD